MLALTFQTAQFQSAAAEKQLVDDGLYATDLLEYLVRKGVPFTDAHHAVGRIVAYSVKTGKKIRTFSLSELKVFAPKADQDAFKLFSAEKSVAGKQTLGSTNPRLVSAQIQSWKKKLK